MTFEHITLQGQRQVGFVNAWNTVAIRGLTSINRVPAVKNLGPTSLMALLDANLNGGAAGVPAIINQKDGVLFARNIKTSGYGWAIDNQSGHKQRLKQTNVEEFVSHDVASLFSVLGTRSAYRSKSRRISPTATHRAGPISRTLVPCPMTNKTMAMAIQRAIDSGADTVYLPKGAYRSRQRIRVRGQVQRLIGFGASLRFDTADRSAFIDCGRRPFGSRSRHRTRDERSKDHYWVQHASTRTLVLHGGSYINTVPGGKVFIEDTTAVPLVFNHQQVWIRQMNTESYQYNPHIVNRGSDVWILGLKTEKDRTIIGTYEGGRTEVFGALLYKNRERIGPAPAFISQTPA